MAERTALEEILSRLERRADLRVFALAEVGLWQLSAYPARHAALAALVREACAPVVPDAKRRAACAGGTVYPVTPAAYWLLGASRAPPPLLAALDPAVGADVDLGDARVRVAIEGAGARALLEQVIDVDLHPAVFEVGHFAQTALHHCPVLLERDATDRYHLWLPRTYARSCLESLCADLLKEELSIP